MTKLEIVKQIARETGIEATTVSAVVEGFMEEVRAAQIRKENVFCAASAPSPSNTTRKRRRVTLRRIRRSKFRHTTFLHLSLLPPSSGFWERNDRPMTITARFECSNRAVCILSLPVFRQTFRRAWSARNFSSPLSVSGCLSSPSIAARGHVATSAPASRHWIICCV